MVVLGVETSCDDTAAAVLKDGRTILANVVSSQDQIHGPYGGVVPELASRQHIRNILPIVDDALQKAGMTLKEIDGIAVTYGPGLVGSLLVGLSLVKGMSFHSGIPYVGVNHLEAHLLAIHLEREVPFPYIALLASGGHTLLYCVNDIGDYLHLGGTRDDAAGEAYDKVAKMMGLGYPGGRVIDNLAKNGDRTAIRFPRARFRKDSYEFSFSGIKTAVWHYLKSRGKGQWEGEIADIAASFQEAVVDMLVNPTIKAAIAARVSRIVLSGGVAANSRLREKITQQGDAEGIDVFFPAPKFCTDNGAMIALAGYHWLKRGRRDDFRLNADADLTL
ncbi:MAG TPA: tRNA (adenosine(37)-N6)-threonylcarbamoyltransferase complex transferase subunit TsaD [Candidatus Binatia bacterium]|jgi:N6-L-threonylcarbamoyladenine synthase|nr:tRNA (adenosine(37)-N6)-threonylcarbamoyltransferase complex transferase subunit TsaD [Candidatus Binatia bacterium]